MFYKDVWRRQCLPALNSVFQQLDLNHKPADLITEAIVALSACWLSRSQPQRKLFVVSSAAGLGVRPDSGHEAQSHEYYGAVMRKMATWSHEDFKARPTLALAVLVLFCYLESSMGNFKEFRVHSKGARTLIRSYADWVVNEGSDIFAAWVEIEMQNWWRRVYFSTPDFHRNSDSILLQPRLDAVLETAKHNRAAVLLIMCESHRLNNAAVISSWEHYGDFSSDDLLSRSVDAAVWNAENDKITLYECQALLQQQSVRLEQWLALLPVTDLPDCWEDGREPATTEQGILDVRPLHFQSHRAAMNFSYYVTARIMQCTEPLSSLDGTLHENIDEMYEEIEAWIMILLRIAAGIDWEECTKLNAYTVGFASLLLACSLRSRRLEAGVWMQGWLEERLSKSNAYEEGNFPVFQVLEGLRLVNAERRDGRDVFAMFQTVDDSGGNGKLGSYHSQMLVALQIYGRCRTSGTMYTYRRTV